MKSNRSAPLADAQAVRQCALACLARRDHSRAELARKLLARGAPPDEVDRLLAELLAAGLLSETRFAEGLVRRRGERLGAARVLHELRRHELPDDVLARAGAELVGSELDRARAVWARRFGSVAATDPRERLRQMRFLAQRGFSADIIRKIVRGGDEDGES